MKKHNFYAGPSILSQYTIKKTADAVLDFANTGLSILEVSHRSKEFQAVVDEAVALTKELLNIPEGYHVLFLGGGASLQFCMVPFNLLKKKAAYINTGTWASNAIKEAKLFGEVDVVASSQESNFNYIPKNFVIPKDVDYFHYTSNNTIYGTETRKDYDSPVPMVCDMSSDIFSREFDCSKYDLIYAEEPRSFRRNDCHCQGRRSRQGEPRDSDYARLPHAHQEGFDVQHSAGASHLLSSYDASLLQGAGRCEGYGEA